MMAMIMDKDWCSVMLTAPDCTVRQVGFVVPAAVKFVLAGTRCLLHQRLHPPHAQNCLWWCLHARHSQEAAHQECDGAGSLPAEGTGRVAGEGTREWQKRDRKITRHHEIVRCAVTLDFLLDFAACVPSTWKTKEVR